MSRKSLARGIVMTVVALTISWLAYPRPPEARTTGPTVTAEGRIVQVDLDGESFTILGPQGTQEFHVTSNTIIELGGTERIAFADLRRFSGTNCTVFSADTGESQDASRVTVLVMPAVASTPKDVGDRTRSFGAADGRSR
jgi:hypothetical protein